MSWYKEPYQRRAAITVHNSGGAGTIDVDVVIPADWDEFWDEIDASGNELRVTSGDGYTLLAYSVDNGSGGAFDKTGRNGRIRIDGASVPATADSIVLFWLYFDTSSNQGSGAVVTTISSPLTGYVERATPSWMIYEAQPLRPGKTGPRETFGKTVADTISVWVDFTDFLEHRRNPYAKRMMFEEPFIAVITAEDSAGANAPTLFTSSAARWVEVYGVRGRRIYLRVTVTAGATATAYTIKVSVSTRVPLISSNNRVHETRFGLRVRNVTEAA